MNRIGLYLDDQRTPTELPPQIDNWMVVRSYKEFVNELVDFVKLHKELPALISFDHDLGPEHIKNYHENKGNPIPYDQIEEMTGLHCAKFLTALMEKNNLKPNYLSVHSHNPVGAENIERWLNHWLKHHHNLDKPCFKMKYKFEYTENV